MRLKIFFDNGKKGFLSKGCKIDLFADKEKCLILLREVDKLIVGCDENE